MSIEQFDSKLEEVDTFLLCEIDLYLSDLEAMVRKFDNSDWDKLSEIWKSRSEKWQLNCIYGIEAVELETADRVIGEMLSSQYKEVVLSSLNSLYDAGCGKWIPDKSQIIVLEGMLDTWHCSEEINGLLDRAKKL